MLKKAVCLFLAFSLILFPLYGCGQQAAVSSASGESALLSSEPASSASTLSEESTPEPESSSGTASEESTGQSEAEEDLSELAAVKTLGPATLYASPSPDSPVSQVEAGVLMTADVTGDPLWYSVILEDGTEGYLYGELLGTIQEDGSVKQSLFEDSFHHTLEILQAMLPDGKYWNHMGLELPWGKETPFLYTDTPCDHARYGEEYCNFYNGVTAQIFPQDTLNQCLGFSSLVSDRIFGENAPIHSYGDLSQLRVGDHIRMREYDHSFIVTEITESHVSVAEVNRDYQHCLISWNKQLTTAEFQSYAWDYACYSRYPLRKNGSGGFENW